MTKNQKLGYLEYVNSIMLLEVKEVQQHQQKKQQRNNRETPAFNFLRKECKLTSTETTQSNKYSKAIS